MGPYIKVSMDETIDFPEIPIPVVLAYKRMFLERELQIWRQVTAQANTHGSFRVTLNEILAFASLLFELYRVFFLSPAPGVLEIYGNPKTRSKFPLLLKRQWVRKVQTLKSILSELQLSPDLQISHFGQKCE